MARIKIENLREDMVISAEELKRVRGGTGDMQFGVNLSYLNLQQDMQAENRQFILLSNIMKIKHDTAKSAIQNIR